MTIFYFTATGNSLAVAKSIAQESDGKAVSIPQVIDSPQLAFKDDSIGIVFPIYDWSLPIMVRRFLDRASLKADYLFAIGTYGSMAYGAMSKLQSQFHYTNKLIMVNNYLPIFEMGKQIKKLPAKKVEENTAKIIADIKNRKPFHVKTNLVTRAMTDIRHGAFNPGKYAQGYIADEKCNACGICAKICPAKNIAVAGKANFSDSCEACMACLHLCPQNALHHKNEKSAKRWRNPNVTLNEIIAANNRLGGEA
ncbi:MAG: EFR1 family ferrodoxin [Spirochaetes bacterium]|nr:EFR1 family ferrodoxin [Spirochaetota bacterium]